jgi:hypothetical protein
MRRSIGGFSLEGRYFIVQVPEEWNEMDPLPPVGPGDQWFDNVSAFKAALCGPWIRKPVRRSMWTGERPVTTTAPIDRPPATAEHRVSPPSGPTWARSHWLGDFTESDGIHGEIAVLGGQLDA